MLSKYNIINIYTYYVGIMYDKSYSKNKIKFSVVDFFEFVNIISFTDIAISLLICNYVIGSVNPHNCYLLVHSRAQLPFQLT